MLKNGATKKIHIQLKKSTAGRQISYLENRRVLRVAHEVAFRHVHAVLSVQLPHLQFFLFRGREGKRSKETKKNNTKITLPGVQKKKMGGRGRGNGPRNEKRKRKNVTRSTKYMHSLYILGREREKQSKETKKNTPAKLKIKNNVPGVQKKTLPGVQNICKYFGKGRGKTVEGNEKKNVPGVYKIY